MQLNQSDMGFTLSHPVDKYKKFIISLWFIANTKSACVGKGEDNTIGKVT